MTDKIVDWDLKNQTNKKIILKCQEIVLLILYNLKKKVEYKSLTLARLYSGLCMPGNFLLIFSYQTKDKRSFKNNMRDSNSLDPDQGTTFCVCD